MNLAATQDRNFLINESDCFDLIERWNLKKEMPWTVSSIFEEIRSVSVVFTDLVFSYISTNLNYLAHNRVSLAFSFDRPSVLSPDEVPAGVCLDSKFRLEPHPVLVDSLVPVVSLQ
ncbi:hypothetical protein PanWU01x14_110100 [Parasponia andersonii]|uniref:Uncharacterized protein n=1 Tax=Parasponia andersonii TaxID=3476 RepID=A0A2P5CZE7_PARAD|nr:hypothetical protein PanWU01x14_110100 [Parasponia andersonii]